MSEEQVITLEIAKNILLKNSKCNLEGFTEIKDDAARILIKLNNSVVRLRWLLEFDAWRQISSKVFAGIKVTSSGLQ